MKVLILTSRFGMGHYCAAEAIKEELLQSDSDDIIEIVDIVKILFPNMYKLIYKVFNLFICRFSRIYNFINSFVTTHEKTGLKKGYLSKINSVVEKYNPDLIVSTWSASSRYISSYKKEYNCEIPLYTYITDVTVHDGWITDMTNMYFVATRDTKEMLISKSVNIKKIVINGIPVRQSFKQELPFDSMNNGQAAIVKPITDNHQLIDENRKKIIIMGGGLGLIPNINNILEKLQETNKISITILVGKNKKLLNKLKNDYPKIDVIGYTNQVYKYMKNADLVITKPGGISTFEAIYSNTPLYVIKPFLSQEVGNAKFIEKMFIGKIAWENNFDISEDIISLISNEKVLGKMKENMKTLREEVSEFKLKKIYERNVNRNVDYNVAAGYSSIFNDIWDHSYGVLQKAK